MVNDLLLTFTGIAQFGIFAGIICLIFGWVDKKEKFSDFGRYIFVGMGIYALGIIFSGQIIIPEGIDKVNSKEAKALSFFTWLVVCSGMALLAVVLKVFKSRYYTWATIVCALLALLLFFMVYNLQKI